VALCTQVASWSGQSLAWAGHRAISPTRTKVTAMSPSRVPVSPYSAIGRSDLAAQSQDLDPRKGHAVSLMVLDKNPPAPLPAREGT
jgi:hypothetical protein